jgi:putative transcriptional regulator
LIASPHLPDPNFYRSVVLMVEHLADGALGLIVNRVSGTRLEAIWQQISETECQSNQSVYVGGPVEGPLMALHTDPDLEGLEVLPEIYFSSERQVIETLVAQQAHRYRIFSGYAGWGPGQLEGELKLGGWLTAPAHADHIFGSHDELWQRVTHGIGDQITRETLNIRHVPIDPRSN